MKKYLFPALALGLVMTSCQSDEPFAPVEGGEKQVTFTLNVPGELGTRAGTEDNNSGVGGFTNKQGNVSYTLVLSAEGHNQTYKKENVTGNTVTFSPTVVLGREYTVTAYAHFNAKAQEDLTNIAETKGINDESKDVYFFTTKENVSDTTINFADGTSYNFDLKRPYAKLRLIAEDYNTSDVNKPITDITKVAVSYNNEVYTVFDAVEGEFKTKANKSYTKDWVANYYEKNVTSGNKTIFADYIPVNGTDVAPFKVTVEYTNGETYTREFNQDIPVKRNALTTLKGNFFTAGAEITVKVDDAFDDNSEEYDLIFTAKELQEALDAAPEGETTLYLGADITGDVTVIQKPDVKITINGNTTRSNVSYNCTIKVHSNSNHYADAALTLNNINFVTSTASHNFIEALENGSERYSTNITVDNCTFEATGEAANTAVGVQIKASKNAKVINCEATGLHSLIQAQSCDESVLVQNCTVNGKNGVAFKQVKSATVEGTTITATGYGIRFDGNTDNYGITVKDNNVTAVQPFIVRRMTGKNNTITLEGTNTLRTEAEYQIVITNGEDDKEYVKPTGTYTLTGADNYTIFPAPCQVDSWDEFTAALAAGETDIKLTADISTSASYTLTKDLKLELNGKAFAIDDATACLYIGDKNNTTKPNVTIKGGNLNCMVYGLSGNVTIKDVVFGGTASYISAYQGVVSTKHANLLMENCKMTNVKKSGSTKPRSLCTEGRSSGYLILRDCNFKNSNLDRPYINPLNGNATLELTNCALYGGASNIDLGKSYSWINMNLTGCSGGFTFTISRASTSLTDEEMAVYKAIKKNNSGSMRFIFTDGEKNNL